MGRRKTKIAPIAEMGPPARGKDAITQITRHSISLPSKNREMINLPLSPVAPSDLFLYPPVRYFVPFSLFYRHPSPCTLPPSSSNFISRTRKTNPLGESILSSILPASSIVSTHHSSLPPCPTLTSPRSTSMQPPPPFPLMPPRL